MKKAPADAPSGSPRSASSVGSTAADNAQIRIQYGTTGRPDLYIRPWPGGDNWQSPDIEVQNVEITGRVTGNIAATDKVELKADCRVVGDVRAPRILIADGASFKGNVDMDVKER